MRIHTVSGYCFFLFLNNLVDIDNIVVLKTLRNLYKSYLQTCKVAKLQSCKVAKLCEICNFASSQVQKFFIITIVNIITIKITKNIDLYYNKAYMLYSFKKIFDSQGSILG